VNTVIVAGFGPFEGVIDNPASALASALDDCVLGGVSVVGRTMPVSHRRGVEVCRMWVESTGAVGLIGVGVAMSRSVITVERTGCRPVDTERCDVDGHSGPDLNGPNPPTVASTLDVGSLARMIDAEVGDDAGTYVCNSWLYQAVLGIDVPVGFIHVPPSGLDPAKLLIALDVLWGSHDVG
jgi:pyrrolidone-carboxylate peptidase